MVMLLLFYCRDRSSRHSSRHESERRMRERSASSDEGLYEEYPYGADGMPYRVSKEWNLNQLPWV